MVEAKEMEKRKEMLRKARESARWDTVGRGRESWLRGWLPFSPGPRYHVSYS